MHHKSDRAGKDGVPEEVEEPEMNKTCEELAEGNTMKETMEGGARDETTEEARERPRAQSSGRWSTVEQIEGGAQMEPRTLPTKVET